MKQEVEEKRRELFESHKEGYSQLFYGLFGQNPHLHVSFGKQDSGEYNSDLVNAAWWAFNAALDSVVIELPKQCAYESLDSARVFVQLSYEIGSHTEDPVELVRREDCCAAIEQTGLGLKVK